MNSIPKQDYGILNQILTKKSDFFKNISKIDDADFERLKRYVGLIFNDFGEFSSRFTKENAQKYMDKIFSTIEKAKNSPNASDDVILPVVREALAEIRGSKEFLTMSKDDLYKFLDTEILPSLEYFSVFSNMPAGAEKAKLLPTDTGLVVNDFLTEYFPDILDYNFTATVEKQFDEIAEGEKKWTGVLHTFYNKFHPSVESTLAAKSPHKAGERILGKEPKTGKQVSVKIGRFGPMAQIGAAGEDEKPRFAQLRKDQSIETITLEEVLDLFKLPRTLGDYDGQPVTVGAGRFGPYVHGHGIYVTLPKEMDPLAITLEEAVSLLKGKMEAEAKRHIKKFDEEPELEIMNGRYGPYIAYKGNNYKIPAGIEPADLSLASCLELVRLQAEKVSTRKKRTPKAAAGKEEKTSKTKTTKA